MIPGLTFAFKLFKQSKSQMTSQYTVQMNVLW